MTEKLFTPLRVGAIDLKNRVVMAPLTRNRAPNDMPGPLQAAYYAQRAGAGLIVTEGSPISPTAKGYADTPGIWSDEQVARWQEVTRAVHDRGGRIVIQLWHVGRVSHTRLLGGAAPVAPSAITAKSRTFVDGAFLPTSDPRALNGSEIPGILQDYAHAARNAIRAGFDGVEIHGANGYLIDQFLRDTSNQRTDSYGGVIENRVRFLQEVVAAVTGAVGADRTGIRISPWSNANDVGIDSNTPALFATVMDVLNAAGLAFVHVVEGQTGGARDWPQGGIEALRARFKGTWIANNGYDRQSAMAAVESGAADAVAFGKLYISNPDLAERLMADAPLNPLPTQGLYGGGKAFYLDYPVLAA